MRYTFCLNKSRFLLAAALSTLLPLTSPFLRLGLANEPITAATWNVGFIDRDVEDLDIEGFTNEVDFDILLVNEVKTQRDLDELKEAMGQDSFFTAISSFDAGTRGLEVGIISRFPLDNVVEFDRSLDNSGSNPEELLERVALPGIADVGVGRGFLVAEISELDLFVIVSHFKSSRGRTGEPDFSNAQKRELVAAAVADHALELLEENPGHTVLFGGDVNVGVTDETKNGRDLTDDRNDGYDETHALLRGDFTEGLSMRSLAQDVDGTFVGRDNVPDFPGTGAIDVLYVAGPLAEEFNPATAASDRYGSDHLAVFTSTGSISDQPDIEEESTETQPPVEPPVEPPVVIIEEDSIVSITNALPNPDGSDTGKEVITLTYGGSSSLDISDWSLRDEADNQYRFPSGTVLIPGDNQLTLTPHTMPLNNDGDTIILLNADGIQQGETFSYTEQEVTSGQPVR